MKKLLVSLLTTSLLAGCASSSFPELEQSTTYSGGELTDSSTRFYWSTETLTTPLTSADYVLNRDASWYKTDYLWSDGKLRELIRHGETLGRSNNLVPFNLQLRFDQNNQAIYQHYVVGGQVLPLNEQQLASFPQQASHVEKTVKEQHSNRTELIQGVWNGKVFKSCDGKRYNKLELSNGLSISEQKSGQYVALVGKALGSTLLAKMLLKTEESSYSCITRPSYIKPQ